MHKRNDNLEHRRVIALLAAAATVLGVFACGDILGLDDLSLAPSCEECSFQQCIDELSACQANTACNDLLTCIQNCPDDACILACPLPTDLDALLLAQEMGDCICANCATACTYCGDAGAGAGGSGGSGGSGGGSGGSGGSSGGAGGGTAGSGGSTGGTGGGAGSGGAGGSGGSAGGSGGSGGT